MAAFYKVNGTLYFANAGHPPPLIKQKDESSWLELKLTKGVNDPLLGYSQAKYTQRAIKRTVWCEAFKRIAKTTPRCATV
jgi:serine phosphatase RsbU (regulator of sigma subunit)